MKKTIVCGVAVALVGAGYFQTIATPQSFSSNAEEFAEYREVLDRYCVTCHSESVGTADLFLDRADVSNISEDAQVWNKVVEKLRAGAMPPVGMPRPDQATYDSFAAYLERELDTAALARPNPGRPLIHRLNRVEYANAVRDLLEVEFDAQSDLPPDGSGEGFDNLAAVLIVSPVLMERYMSVARKISRVAIGSSSAPVIGETYRVSEA